MADSAEAESVVASQAATLDRQRVCFERGDTTDRRALDRLTTTPYDHVVVLSYSDTLGPQEADALRLTTLLRLRDIAEKTGQRYSIVSEMLDIRNRELAEVTRVDDFIVSDRLVSLMLAQVSENKQLSAVFGELFDPEGSELYLKPAEEYVRPGQPLHFYTVVEAARQRGEVAVGYQQRGQDGNDARRRGVILNPKKSEEIPFAQGDRIIVLAES